MRSATVVLPVPGLPVKHMCRLGAGACRPSPAQPVDDQQRRDVADALLDRRQADQVAVELGEHRSTWLSRSTSATVRGCAAAVRGSRVPGAPTMLYTGMPSRQRPGHCRNQAASASGAGQPPRSSRASPPSRPRSRLAEDRAAGDEGVGTGVGHAADVVDLDAAVDLQPDVAAAASIDQAARLLDLAQALSMKLWPPKPGLTLMISTRSTLVDRPLQHVQRFRRVERQPDLAARCADQLQRAVDMPAGVRVEADQVGAGLGKALASASTGCTIRCTSSSTWLPSGRWVYFFSACATECPIVRLGT
jgi:hypothetical protein